MRIYIAGGGGMLGDAVYKHFYLKGHDLDVTDIKPTEAYIDQLDVRDYHAQHGRISYFRPHVIINLAALTDLEYCEGHAQEAMDTNCGGSANLAALSQKFGARYVYISTAGIFDGLQKEYSEYDTPNPLSIYGKAKHYGELIALSIPGAIVLRPGWMMGGGPSKDKKFINKLYKQLRSSKDGEYVINAVADKCGTPTYTVDLAKQIDKLLCHTDKVFAGLFNCTCLGSTNRYEIAQEFLRLMDVQNVRLELVTSDYFKDAYHAPRPASEVLRAVRLDVSGLNVMRDWKECLAEYVKEFPKL
jgi:dTDP-4-dehydrorhamnose reductase